MKRSIAAVAAGLVLATAGAGVAAVTFDTSDGTGFVGKGDVQTLFAWNNAQLQANAGGLQWRTQGLQKYEFVCDYDKNSGPASKEIKVNLNLNGQVQYDARKSNQVTGFLLTGWTGQGAGGDPPEYGDGCKVGNDEGTIRAGTIEMVSDTFSGVEVKSGGGGWHLIS
jgi:hypothetical protein